MNYFVTAIGTDCGKTIASAILCRALGADYWKPVQAGLPSDSDTIRSLTDRSETIIHPETFVLKTPASPHAAAPLDGVNIQLDDFKIPSNRSHLIIEGAGGCLVPLNEENFVIDLAKKFDAQVILVSNFYLGSINHTLLSCEALTARKRKVSGIIFNGPRNHESERIILKHSGLRCLLHIDEEPVVDTEMIIKYSKMLRASWNG
jgi:dethiobiotin synthetase